jgi:hypothetical protein
MDGERGPELLGRDEELDAAVAVEDREGERQRRVLDVAAADVEEPGDRIGRAQHRGVEPVPGERGGDAGALGRGVLAGEGAIVRHHRRQRRRRAVGPDRVERVAVEPDEAPARLLGGGAQALELGQGVQPRVVGERLAGPEIGRDPARRRRLGEMAMLEHGPVDLVGRLQRVAPVDEDRRPLGKNDGRPRGAGEAGQPSEALRRLRHILALVLVGARHDEAVETPCGERPAQGGQPLGAPARIGFVGEVLEHRRHR